MSGELSLEEGDGAWTARIAGRTASVARERDEIRFRLPDGEGEFRGRLDDRTGAIRGHWIQPAGAVSFQPRATPVELGVAGNSRWAGEVTPLAEHPRIYVNIRRTHDDALTAVIRIPENNRWGNTVFAVERRGDQVSLRDTYRELRGRFDHRKRQLILPLAQGEPLVLVPCRPQEATGFFARVYGSGAVDLTQPATLRDGWSTASLEAVALNPQPIRELIQSLLDADPNADDAVHVHSLLIARHGRLAVEEYFHGFDRSRPHDLRSAGKTLAPMLVGVARKRHAKIEPDTPLYGLFPAYRPFANWDERKSKVTLRDLMTMTSGLACDDNDGASPGNEDTMQEQRSQPDWYKYTLDLPLVHEPGGANAVYNSASLNLTGGVAARASGLWLGELFQLHVAQPLEFGRYHLNLMPTGEVYTGGGAYLLPRDSLKIGQLYLDGGTWNGVQVLDREWVEWSTTPHTTFVRPVNELDTEHHYGFGWHIHHFQVAGRKFRQFAAEGNGGQFIMVFPELAMVVGINAGSYGSAHWYRWGLKIIPKYLIPAALEPVAKSVHSESLPRGEQAPEVGVTAVAESTASQATIDYFGIKPLRASAGIFNGRYLFFGRHDRKQSDLFWRATSANGITLVPSRRAALVNPIEALRSE